jgi:hypothetical protein
MKRYSELTTNEKLALSNEDFQTAATMEAIERGIKPPIKISEILRQDEWVGFSVPPDSVIFYEIMCPAQYGDAKPTGLLFRTSEEAWASINGALSCYEDGYGATKKKKMAIGDFSVQEIHISTSRAISQRLKIEEFFQDNTDFEKLLEEICNEQSALQQEKYNAEVSKQKREQYLELAKGDEEIAKAFWSKAERTDWPSAAYPQPRAN